MQNKKALYSTYNNIIFFNFFLLYKNEGKNVLHKWANRKSILVDNLLKSIIA